MQFSECFQEYLDEIGAMPNSNGKCTVEWNWANNSSFMAGLLNGKNISSNAMEPALF